MNKNWIKELPTTSMNALLEKLLQNDLLIEGLMPAQEIEDARVDYHRLSDELMRKIRETNNQILSTKTKDEAATAEARLRLYKGERQKIIVLSQKAAVKCLLRGDYYAAAYLGGEMVIIPSRAWSGKIDWDEEKIMFARKEYSHFCIISHGRLPKEQIKLIEQYASGDIDAQFDKNEGPGRPTGIYLIEPKLRQRAEAGDLEDSLSRESQVLAKWFKLNHPDEKPVTAKAIENKFRSLYRELKSKSA